MVGIGVGVAIAGVASTVGTALTADTDAAGEAAGLAAAGQQKGIAEIKEQLRLAEERANPFITAGETALPGVEQASTVGGLDERLDEIFRSPNFRTLVDERGRAVRSQLAASGNSRSGAGLLEAARVPTELGFDIEQLLAKRLGGLADQGFSAGLNLSQFGQSAARGIAGIEGEIGDIQAQGHLGDAQARTARTEALFNAGTKGIGTLQTAGLF